MPKLPGGDLSLRVSLQMLDPFFSKDLRFFGSSLISCSNSICEIEESLCDLEHIAAFEV